MPLFRVQFRRDTTENWEKYNPILLEGEVGYEVTKTPGLILMKQGDGYIAADGKIYGTPWNDLPYCSGPMGPSPDYQWDGTILMFKKPDGTWGPGQDLVGPVPAHRWIGTALQFQTQTGAWGNLVDLQGTPGNANLLPATPTKIGGIIIGPGLDVNEQGCASVDKDFIYGLGGNLLMNDEIWITESGTFTAPVTGWYEVTCIGGGEGGAYKGENAYVPVVFGGSSGEYKTEFVYLQEGESINVIIGAGGVGAHADTYHLGCDTTFGAIVASGGNSISTDDKLKRFPGITQIGHADRDLYGQGGGYGGSVAGVNPAQYYGGAGGAWYYSLTNNSGTFATTDGYQGAVILHFWNPMKAAGPVVSKARMALARSAKIATVNLYDPETGQGSVWREEDAEAQLERGLITQEAWREICEAEAAERRAAWLSDPSTESERFEMLRFACEAKLSATDKLVQPDYPISEETRAAVTAYRQAIRELNHQTGAPWDGGGEQTPWPEEPPFLAAILNREQPTDE